MVYIACSEYAWFVIREAGSSLQLECTWTDIVYLTNSGMMNFIVITVYCCCSKFLVIWICCVQFQENAWCRCHAETDSSNLPCSCTSLPLCLLQVEIWFVKGCLSSAPLSAKSNSCGVGLRSSTIHLRLTHPTTTAAVGQSPLQLVPCFIAHNKFPVGNRMLTKFSIQSPFAACGSGGVGAVSELITGSLLRPTWRWQIRRLINEECLLQAQADFRKGSRLLGWLKRHSKCFEQKRQMVRMLNSELTFLLANVLSKAVFW